MGAGSENRPYVERGKGSNTAYRPIVQNGYYDHVLRQEEDPRKVIAYLLANPLRAGLVRDVRQYPFWGSGVWERDQLVDAVQHLITDRGRAG